MLFCDKETMETIADIDIEVFVCTQIIVVINQ
jgi:hypothetical protein